MAGDGFTVLVGAFPSATFPVSVQPGGRGGQLRSRAIRPGRISGIYLVADFAGAAVAAGAFKGLNPAEREDVARSVHGINRESTGKLPNRLPARAVIK